ncbi:MAG TPA: guanylate kinase [Thermodesulfobacteriota bacterium]|nr:guanylate kinase [Thermodesulfobacteriota bacterium]
MREGNIFIISGPSGGGKTTLVKKVLESMNNLRFSVSCTTRKPRPGEVNGRDYIFVSDSGFGKMIEEGKFAEYAKVHDHMYGTPIAELDNAAKSGDDLILDIDVQGARQIRQRFGSGVYCFVLPSSFEILKERLKRRGSEDKGEMDRRLSEARQEMEEIGSYDYIIINDDLDRAGECLRSIIISTRCGREKALNIVKKGYSSE